MCDKECKDNTAVQLTKINGKLDGLVGIFEAFKESSDEVSKDKENRLRLLEQKTCPMHKDIVDNIQTLNTNTAVRDGQFRTTIAITTFVCGIVFQAVLLLYQTITG